MNEQGRISQAYGEKLGTLDILMINDRPYFPATKCSCAPGCKSSHKTIRNHYKGASESPDPTVKDTQRKAGHQPIQKGAAWSA
jgi:hypothetical protein